MLHARNGGIILSVIEWIYNFKLKLFPVDTIGFNAGFKYIKVYMQFITDLSLFAHIYISKYLCFIKSTAEKKVHTCIELVVKL